MTDSELSTIRGLTLLSPDWRKMGDPFVIKMPSGGLLYTSPPNAGLHPVTRLEVDVGDSWLSSLRQQPRATRGQRPKHLPGSKIAKRRLRAKAASAARKITRKAA